MALSMAACGGAPRSMSLAADLDLPREDAWTAVEAVALAEDEVAQAPHPIRLDWHLPWAVPTSLLPESWLDPALRWPERWASLDDLLQCRDERCQSGWTEPPEDWVGSWFGPPWHPRH